VSISICSTSTDSTAASSTFATAFGEPAACSSTLLGANAWDDEPDDEANTSAGWGARLLMVPVLVFFGVATLCGCLLLGIVRLRLRAAARRPDVSDGDLCELEQANRISSVAVIASLVGLAVVGLAYLLL
jgi:hypothetical protein